MKSLFTIIILIAATLFSSCNTQKEKQQEISIINNGKSISIALYKTRDLYGVYPKDLTDLVTRGTYTQEEFDEIVLKHDWDYFPENAANFEHAILVTPEEIGSNGHVVILVNGSALTVPNGELSKYGVKP